MRILELSTVYAMRAWVLLSQFPETAL